MKQAGTQKNCDSSRLLISGVAQACLCVLGVVKKPGHKKDSIARSAPKKCVCVCQAQQTSASVQFAEELRCKMSTNKLHMVLPQANRKVFSIRNLPKKMFDK